MISKEVLTMEYLLKNPYSTFNLENGYTLSIKLEKDDVKEDIYNLLLKKYPVLQSKIMTKHIYYNDCMDINVILSFVWIVKWYFTKNVLLFLPKYIIRNIEEIISDFNEYCLDYFSRSFLSCL
jgi:hypothetical protein